MKCENCGLDPYEYVNVGIGSIPVAVNCCDVGQIMYEGGMSLEDARAEIKARDLEAEKQWEAYKNSPDYLSKCDIDTGIPF